MKVHRLIVPVMLFVLTTAVHGQVLENFSRTKAITIKSTILDESRAISIYLPNNYKYSKVKCPVLYLLDGEAHLQHASAAAEYLSIWGLIPDIIVVAIHNIDRSRDFSPVHVDNIPTSGGAEKFLGFLAEELILCHSWMRITGLLDSICCWDTLLVELS